MKKVLYAEDNPGMRRMVCCFLEAAGFEVVAVTDGDEAIEIAKNGQFDVILLDVTMERVDGIDATREIRRIESDTRKSKIPIIGLTGRSESEEIQICEAAGMNIVLTKPVDLELLAETIISAANSAPKHCNLKHNLHHETAPKIIDIEVLASYRTNVGAAELEGVLRDFSDIWPRKIGELYTSMVNENDIGFARASEELGAAAAGIGAGKVAHFASILASSTEFEARSAIMPATVKACEEVQFLVNALSLDTGIGDSSQQIIECKFGT